MNVARPGTCSRGLPRTINIRAGDIREACIRFNVIVDGE